MFIDLEPADIVLSGDSSPLARAIQMFDETPYHHAALALDAGRVAEALLTEGICVRSPTVSLAPRHRALVRRMIPARRSRANGNVVSLDAIVACAEDVLCEGHRYAYEQLLTLAVLLLARNVPRTASFGRTVAAVLEGAVSLMRESLTVSGPFRHTPMVCSGFVAYCFAEATPRGTFALEIAAPLRTRGVLRQRVALGSLLDGLIRQQPARVLEFQSASKASIDLIDIETAVGNYLDEISTRSRSVAPPQRIDDAEAATMRFALRYWQAIGNDTSYGTRGVVGASGQAVLEAVAQLAERLVTPGDLLRSPTLMDVGVPRAGEHTPRSDHV
jgi:hypothetical protein